ncbi:MFS transporter [Candidatus Pelagibacter sp.]|nr:MFS transporter [Candidatus Pelagibacter sp.]
MIEIKKQSLSETFSVYLDKRMIRILLLGAISGFPWVLIGSSLSLWLKEEGLSRSTIGWAGLIFGVYAINYFWAPLVDRIKIPLLTNKFGHRRGWIFSMQALILISLIIWSYINPTENLYLLIFVGLIIAIASATQDITVDALRIEQIKQSEKKAMAAGAAIAVVGWWSGYKIGGVISLFTAEYFENIGIVNYWQKTFLILGIIVILMNIALIFVQESKNISREKVHTKNDKIAERKIITSSQNSLIFFIGIALFIFIEAYLLSKILGNHFFNFIPNTIFFNILIFIIGLFGFAMITAHSQFGRSLSSWFGSTIGGPFFSFFKQNAINQKNKRSEQNILSLILKFFRKYKIGIYILLFVFLFKIGEAFLGRMSIVFYKEIGFTKGDIAIYSKAFGWITTVIFTLLGGIFAMRAGTIKTMFVAGVLMAGSNLLFSLLNWFIQTIPLTIYQFDMNFISHTWDFEISNHQLVFGLTVILDDIAAAFATVAFVAFISLLVNRAYTATQYALLASLGTAGRTLMASSSGALVDWLNGDWGTFFILTALMVIPSLILLWSMRYKIKLNE